MIKKDLPKAVVSTIQNPTNDIDKKWLSIAHSGGLNMIKELETVSTKGIIEKAKELERANDYLRLLKENKESVHDEAYNKQVEEANNKKKALEEELNKLKRKGLEYEKNKDVEKVYKNIGEYL